jgi:hypothetical protein
VTQNPAMLVYRDREHLRVLSTCYYVLSGLAFLGGCFPFIHITLGILMLNGALPPAKGDPNFPSFIGWLLIIIGSIVVLFGWTVGVVCLLVARRLARATHYHFCLVGAGIGCIFMPLGTILGVFAILVLCRDSVRALFADGPQTPPVQPSGYAPPPPSL